MSGRLFPLTMTTALVLGSMSAGHVHAQEVIAVGAAKSPIIDEKLSLEQRLTALEGKVREQQALLDQQEQTLRRQEALIDRQAVALSWRALGGGGLDALRGRGASGAPAAATDTTQVPASAEGGAVQQSAGQVGPVGEAPPTEPAQNLNAALPPETTGVLTRPGHFTLEPSFTYSLSSSDRLVFRGVEIVTGIQIGVIEADQAQRNTGMATLAGRIGLTDRSELEVRVPYIYRRDVVTTLAQRDQAITTTSDLNAANIGDIEITGRYQLNAASARWPVIVANLRAKSDSGTNPYTVPRDQFGVAEGLATGSGFWAVEPSVSFLFVSDPAVLFGNVSYLHSFPKNINRMIGNVPVGRVTPGDSPGITGGFGFSLNPQFSFSLGYRHNYIFGTTTELGGTKQRSTSLQVGSLLFGMSYAMNRNYSLNAQIEMGVTRDAPDVTLTLRTPIAF
ncbi:MAG: transporter [Caulobacteraceae bacterium]